MNVRASRLLPCLSWLRHYDRQAAGKDLTAALIVTLMLIPQSLAYALLAGLPPASTRAFCRCWPTPCSAPAVR
jgi:SulP family sulfate permease